MVPTEASLVDNGRVSDPSARSSVYRLIWRWHFYAGLFCIPFVVWLSITGSIYLFHPQIDAWFDRPYNHVDAHLPQLPVSDQVNAALAVVPGGVLNAYQLPGDAHDAAQVLVGKGASLRRIYVDPVTGRVLHNVVEDGRFTSVLFHLHGELLMGDGGSAVVELAASWTILMLVTGLYLWWPRGRRAAGVLYPRWGAKGRLFLRDLHAVVGVWVSLLALFLLFTGLPWAKFWGGALKDVRRFASHPVVQQDWTTGRASELAQRRAMNTPFVVQASDASDHSAHHAALPGAAPVDYAPLNRIVPVVRELDLAPPVLVTPPSGMSPHWGARSDASNRPLRVNLTLDPATGRVLKRVDFRQRPWLDRVIGYGVAAHEGQLFGLANQMLGVFTALGLITVSISAVMMWWKRRPAQTLGAPPPHAGSTYPKLWIGVLVALGVYLPLLGISMIVVLLLERLVLSRIPPLKHFLGLTA